MRLLISLLSFICFLSGCTRSPEPTLYVLNPIELPYIQTRNISIRLGIDEIHLPDYLDKSPLMLFIQPNKAMLNEQHQWAASLSSNIKQVINANLSLLLPHSQIESAPWSSYFTPDYHLAITLNQFKFTSEGTSLLSASYRLYREEKLIKQRHIHLKTAVTPSNWSTLVIAGNQQLNQLTIDIANSIKSTR